MTPSDWVHCGREFSAQEVAEVCATVAWLPGLARRELAATLCEHLGWVTLTGTAKVDACLEFLKRLQAAGLLVLPTPRPSPRRRSMPPRAVVEPLVEESPVDHAAVGPAPVRLEVIRDTALATHWDDLMARWHPLGFQGAFGYRLRYFITAGELRLGCVLLSGAARAVAVRDAWIGWTAQARRQNLPRVLNNSRFLIFPHVRVPHLASQVLGQLARRAHARTGSNTGASSPCCWKLRRPATPCRHLLPGCRLAMARRDQWAGWPVRAQSYQHAPPSVGQAAWQRWSRPVVRRNRDPRPVEQTLPSSDAPAFRRNAARDGRRRL
ncbi:MAG: DUF4338 domain-containing protein [Candidatus Accumulibacter sp.]|nr:DUF4338 domain-containing protein [Candidatus Accumulibacter propinquus]